jgi:hypothetical protein
MARRKDAAPEGSDGDREVLLNAATVVFAERGLPGAGR